MANNTQGLRQVGEFGASSRKRPMIRSMRNPMDVSSIISIYPRDIHVSKPVQPSEYTIKKGSLEDPGITIISGASWWKDNGADQPILEIPVSSVQVAEAIVMDFANSIPGSNGRKAMPGLFIALGRVDASKVKLEHSDKLAEMQERQMEWYKILIRQADSLWARTNGNPLSVSDSMRLAAIELGEEDKPWLARYEVADLEKCVACGSMKNPAFPVCQVCHHIDQSHPAASSLTFTHSNPPATAMVNPFDKPQTS